MKKSIVIFLVIMASVVQASAQTATPSAKKTAHKKTAKIVAKDKDAHKLSTNVDFEDQLVNGKYQYPDEAIATVEDDKLLDDLLAVRKNFKDRLKQTSSRN